MKLHMDVIVMCEKIFPIIDLIIKPNIPWKYVLRRFKFYNLFSETFYEKMENSQSGEIMIILIMLQRLF